MSKERLEKFKKIEELSEVDGFCEQLVDTEKKFKSELRNNFNFSRKEYNVFGTTFWLGKVDNWYFLGNKRETTNEFLFFKNKKMIQMYLTNEFKDLEVEQKGFWMREVEIF